MTSFELRISGRVPLNYWRQAPYILVGNIWSIFILKVFTIGKDFTQQRNSPISQNIMLSGRYFMFTV